MDFELTDDQVALRDGIRSLLRGPVPDRARPRRVRPRRCTTSSPRRACSRCGPTASAWADAAVVFEELGRAVVPGPLVWLYLANGLVDGVVGGLEVARRRPPWMVEHLDVLDTLLVVDDDGVQSVAAGKVAGALPVARPLDQRYRRRLR